MSAEAIYPDLVLMEFKENGEPYSALLRSNLADHALVLARREGKIIMRKSYLDRPFEQKNVIEIKEQYVGARFERVGDGEGISFFHCWYMGYKFVKLFYERVSAYAILTPTHGDVAIAFYTEKVRPN
jgi:hypothetical protein